MLESIITSSILIGLLILMRRLSRSRISSRLQYSLWLLAAVRLLMPAALFENPFNVMNRLYPAAEQIEEWGAAAVKKQLPEESTEARRKEERLLEENIEKSLSDDQFFLEIGSLFRKPETISEHKAPDNFSPERLLRKIWQTGIGVMSIWMISVNLLYRRRLALNRKYLGREGRIRIYVSENAGTPCLIGILYPVIYLTPGSAQRQNHQKYAIAHELAHYRHGDHIWSFVRNLCLIIHWFNPLVWVGARLAAQDCELACDESVLRLLGTDQRQEYGRTLIEMAASFHRPWMLSCETSLASGKRELKERIIHIAAGKKNTGLWTIFTILICTATLAACTFGKAVAAPAMGRYVESAVKFTGTDSVKTFPAIVQEGKTIRLIANAGFDLLSLDGGITFEKVHAEDMPAGTMDLYTRSAIRMTGSTGGARAFQTYISSTKDGAVFGNFLITEAGEEIRREIPEQNSTWYYYGSGSFFADEKSGTTDRYYKIDPVTGESQFLAESTWSASHTAADERLLYLTNENGVLLFDLKTKAAAAKQDQTLSDFVAENASLSDQYPAVLYPYRDGVYILTRKGLFWHKLYEKNIEPIIDGALCSIVNGYFTGMALRETEGEPEFLILYDRKKLVRYTYDASLPAVPEDRHLSR